MASLSDLLTSLASGGQGAPSSATAAVPPQPLAPNFVPDDAISQQYSLANKLRNVAPATSWAGVLANGLGAVGGNLVQGDANNALGNNQALRKQDIQSAASATDLPSLEKSLISAQTPDIQNLGLQTKIKQITDDPSKDYRVRAAQALQYGLQQGTQPFRDFVLTGKLPNVDSPMNVKEWNFFSKLPPDQQQQYLTMKRSEKYLDTGTEFVRPNPVAPGQNISAIPKNVAGEAEQKDIGKDVAKAKTDLPTAVNNADKIIRTIDSVVNDKDLPSMIGPIAGRLPNISGKSQDLQAKMDQIGGQSFLQAYGALRGGGSITEVEGAKATASLNRLQNAKVGTAEWIAAAKEFRQDVVDLANIAKRKASGNYAPLPAPNLDAPGALPPGYKIERVQ